MALIEFYDDHAVRPPIQVFATDLSDQRSLEKARAGVYPESIEGEVSTERLQRFFTHANHIYRIDKALRDMCIFARQNVASDPPFSHLDIISCRNVLIYLASPLQRRVLPTFHYALNMHGFLVLGTAETVGENQDLFELVDRSNKIYVKKMAPARPAYFASEGLQNSVAAFTGRHTASTHLTPAIFSARLTGSCGTLRPACGARQRTFRYRAIPRPYQPLPRVPAWRAHIQSAENGTRRVVSRSSQPSPRPCNLARPSADPTFGSGTTEVLARLIWRSCL